jgi:mono/diheme cytochrome c family protein
MKLASMIGVALALAVSGPAYAQVRAMAGHELARQWCAGCHQVEAEGIARDSAPSFINLANDRSEELNWVRTRLQTPLYPMSGINLSNEQIEDIVAYFETLKMDAH